MSFNICEGLQNVAPVQDTTRSTNTECAAKTKGGKCYELSLCAKRRTREER